MECAFCNAGILKNQSFYSSKLISVLYNHKPLLTGHSLVIPKRHIANFEDLTSEEITEMHEAIKIVNKIFKQVYNSTAFTLVLQNGKDAGQTVFHTHFHIVPRKKDDIENHELYSKIMLNTHQREEISEKEMNERIKELREAIC